MPDMTSLQNFKDTSSTCTSFDLQFKVHSQRLSNRPPQSPQHHQILVPSPMLDRELPVSMAKSQSQRWQVGAKAKWVGTRSPAKTPCNEHATASRCLRIKHAPKIISCIEKRDTITKLLSWLAESPFPQLKELDPHLVGDLIGSPWIICLIRQPLHCGRGRRRWGYRNQCCWCVPRWRWLWRLGPRRRRRSSFGSLGPRRHGWWLPGHWCWTSWHLSSWRWSHSWLWMVLPQRQASSIND